MFSLRNNEDVEPFVAYIKPGEEDYAVFCNSDWGPGLGVDMGISNCANESQLSFAQLGTTFQLPPDVCNARTFLAGSLYFTPSEVEVFN